MHTVNIKLLFNHIQDNIINKKAYIHEYFIIYTLSIKTLQIEYTKHERSGIYGFIQVLMAYNSNKIEGSTLTEEQTASLFDTGVLPKSEDYYRAKDVEEMNGHFLMFNKMLDTLDLELTEELIKAFHYELKRRGIRRSRKWLRNRRL